MLTPAQLRMARAALQWTQKDLAQRARVHANAIKAIEAGKSDPKQSTLIALRTALANAGVEFLEADGKRGAGVRLREPAR